MGDRRPGDALYRFLRGALDVTVWGGSLICDPDLPFTHGAVFVANHAGALGPIGIVCSLPVRLHPWIAGDMVDPQKAGAYLLKDFTGPELHLPDAAAAVAARVLARVTVPLLRGIGCIPVWTDRDLLETYRISSERLAAGRSLLIFPEDPSGRISERTGMRPFKTGFAHLGLQHYMATGRSVPFYPVAVDRRRRTVRVGEPIRHNAAAPEGSERRRVAHTLETIIAGMLSDGNAPTEIGIRATR